MPRILLDAIAYYRDDAEDMLIIVAPAVVLGPILVIFASSGLRASLGTIPAFLLVYILTYAACVRAAGLLRKGLRPEPVVAYLDVLKNASWLLRAVAPGPLLVALVSGAALVVSDLVHPTPALAVGLLGPLIAFLWARRHVYDQPLVLAHGLAAAEATQVSSQVTGGNMLWTTLLLSLVSTPLLATLLLSWGLAAALTPASGAIVFAAALALWLPFSALSFTAASGDLFGRIPPR